jgi:tetratricopeptide (TPR) repeat protein
VARPKHETGQVQVRRGELVLPTYRLLGENRNPVFRSQYGVAHIYPYTLQDEIAPQPTPTTYSTLELENPYLRLTILPELGGRVYSLLDKLAGREVFYRNPVVRFAPLAIRGAFFSGGLEFSFPVAHAPTTASPVNWTTRRHPDGSASISIGGVEHLSGMRWTVSLTLFQDRCAVAQDVRLHNPTPVPGRYHYWTNASLASDDQTEFVYPMRRVRSYEFAGTAPWPIARLDLIAAEPGLPGMEGVPMWPAGRMHAPVDFRHEKDMLAQVSIFGRDVRDSFFGAWQHSTDSGYAHCADVKDVAGMKLWSWGRSEVGIVNQSALTDDGSLYAETQCGAMETQLDFDFLPPAETRSWREWWLPLRGLGGLTCASPEAGARLAVTQGDGDRLDLLAAVCPTRPLEEARLTLAVSDRSLLDEVIACSPAAPWSKKIQLDPSSLGDQPISLRIADGQGKVILERVFERRAEVAASRTAPLAETGDTPAAAYEQGTRHENLDNRFQAMQAYRRALALSDELAPAHLRLGLMLLRGADLETAREHFEKAAAHGLAAAHYYLGRVAVYKGDAAGAGARYVQVPQADPLWPAAQHGLACLALGSGRWEEALKHIQAAEDRSGQSMHSSLLSGMALRRAGKADAAAKALDRVLAVDPLNHAALRERSQIDPPAPGDDDAPLDRLLADDPEYPLDLACFYLDCGLRQDALSVLKATRPDPQPPMYGYLTAFIAAGLGDRELAEEFALAASRAGPDHGFPSRLWEVAALRRQIEQGPPDPKARYYLGNFCFAHQRFAEAAALWEEARRSLADFDVIHRNLGLFALQFEKDPERAIDWFEQALRLNPQNQDLYLELDTLYRDQGLPEKRIQLLQSMQNLQPLREDVRKRKLSMLVDLGRYDEALHILSAEQFVPLEMDQSFHQVYGRALLQRAEAHLAAGRLEAAAQDYTSALDFPANHGVGRPTTRSDAEILYRLGCVYEKLGRYGQAIRAWKTAGSEHHALGEDLYEFVQRSLDKLGRYGELGFGV